MTNRHYLLVVTLLRLPLHTFWAFIPRRYFVITPRYVATFRVPRFGLRSPHTLAYPVGFTLCVCLLPFVVVLTRNIHASSVLGSTDRSTTTHGYPSYYCGTTTTQFTGYVIPFGPDLTTGLFALCHCDTCYFAACPLYAVRAFSRATPDWVLRGSSVHRRTTCSLPFTPGAYLPLRLVALRAPLRATTYLPGSARVHLPPHTFAYAPRFTAPHTTLQPTATPFFFTGTHSACFLQFVPPISGPACIRALPRFWTAHAPCLLPHLLHIATLSLYSPYYTPPLQFTYVCSADLRLNYIEPQCCSSGFD